MPLGNRMKILREVFNCRVGPGSAVLPRDVTRIHLTFSTLFTDGSGHTAPRLFWKQYLPRVKYHNPAVSIVVDRKREHNVKAEMIIHFATKATKGATKASSAALTKAGAPGGPDNATVAENSEAEDTKVIDLHKTEKPEEVYKKFLEATGATPVQHTEAELAQVQAFIDLNKKKAVDRERQQLAAARLKAEQQAEEKARAAAAAAQ